MKETAVIERLIRIGASPDSDNDEDIRLLKYSGRINIPKGGKGFWYELAPNLTDDELLFLIRGITIAEREHRWIGGSAAAAIWLFNVLQTRATEEELDELIVWIRKNTNNSYLPFGSMFDASFSMEEHREWLEWKKEVKKRLSFIEAKAAKERANRDKQRERSLQDRKTDFREKLINELVQLPVKEKFKRIAEDENYVVSFFPTCWAYQISDEELDNLDDEVKTLLAKKLKGKQRGPWGRFKKKLLSKQETLWNLPELNTLGALLLIRNSMVESSK